MEITKRLKIVSSFIPKKRTVYDIGCDHALLDIFLTIYNENKCYACDIKESALSFAVKNINKYNLTDKIRVICSNGFTNIEVEENSIAVITGMGTSTILDILSNSQINKIDFFIIQSNNDHFLLRKELAKRNLKIVDEIVVYDKGIYYLTFKVVHGKVKYSKKDLEFGPILRKDDSIDTLMYYNNVLKQKITILKKMPGKYLGKKIKLICDIKWLKKNLKNKKIKEKM